MSSSSLSRRTGQVRAHRSVSLAVVSIALLAGGCAVGDNGPSRVAGPPVTFPGDLPPLPKQPAVQSMKIEVEDDGLPSQLAPKIRRAMPDEPQEPWSPNYGSRKAVGLDPERLAAKLDVAQAAPPAPVYKPSARPIDADDVIRRAIAEHEMRQR